MLPSYKDIIDRAGAPDWYDENGAPRYGDFSPRKVTVYGDECALYLIACQECGAEFKVAYVFDRMREAFAGVEDPQPSEPKALHFGDPPFDGHTSNCSAGATMNCEDIRVLEWWLRSKVSHKWERVPEKEVEIQEAVK